MTRRHSALLLVAVLGLALVGGLLLTNERRGGGPGAPGRAGAELGDSGADAGPAPVLVPVELAALGRVEAGEVGEVEATPGSEGAPAPRPASLAGVVALPPGFPGDASVRLRAWPVAGDDVAPAFLDLAAGETRWRFEGLAPGAWVVSARAEGATRSGPRIGWGRADAVELSPGDARTGVRVGLHEYVITGTVTDARGVPVAGQHVDHCWSASDPQAGEVRDGAQDLEVWTAPGPDGEVILSYSGATSGAFRIQTMPSETYGAEEERAARVIGRGASARPSPRVGPHFGVASAPRPTISLGTSTREFERISLTDLVASAPAPAPGRWSLEGYHADHVVTDAAGVFRIPLPGPGDVELVAPGSEQPDAEVSYLRQEQAVSVSSADPAASASFQLVRAAALEGRLTRSDASDDPIEVFLRPVSGGDTVSTSADDEGGYRFEYLAPGEYLFYARSGGPEGQDFCTHDRLLFEDGGTFGHDDVLTASSVVEGRLVDRAGAPLEGQTVVAFGQDNRSLSREATTGPDGRFRIPGMYPCAHLLTARGLELEGQVDVVVPPRGALVDVGTLVGRPARPRVR